MKREDVKVGVSYRAKVAGKAAIVQIREEMWGQRKGADALIGWKALNAATGRSVTIRSPRRLHPLGSGAESAEAQVGEPTAAGSEPAASPRPRRAPHRRAAKGSKSKSPSMPRPDAERPPSLVTAAYAALKATSRDGMSAKDMVEAAPRHGWTPGKGKTPEATLVAAIIREIATKGKDARFRKVAPGLYAAK